MTQLTNDNGIYRLRRNNTPFLILGGELGNSSASSLEYMEKIWPRLVMMNLNTVLVPVSWELMEPKEGKFDFRLLDGLIAKARRHRLKLVLLWFGSWKNSMSCYAPAWIKENQAKYPRARLPDGTPMEILSAFSETNRDADAKAFAALMRHLSAIDRHKGSVLMVQVENEVAMVEQARDHDDAANKAYAADVPRTLIEYLNLHVDTLHPDMLRLWTEFGRRVSGTWEDVFGPGLEGKEIFSAWHHAIYVEHIANAGKREYHLPMYTNAVLNRPGKKPGEYPGGGPLPYLLDIWRAAAPDLDFYAPDIYYPDFSAWCEKYHTAANPLFIPEATLDQSSGINALYAIGKHRTLGFSPFAIESAESESAARLAACYAMVRELMPLILAIKDAGQMTAFRLDNDTPAVKFPFGDFDCECGHTFSLPWSPCKGESVLPAAGAILIALSSREIIVGGNGVYINFTSRQKGEHAGILTIEEGRFKNGHWVGGRRMNGDESHQGRHLRIEYGTWSVQKIKLYTYR